MNFMKIYRVEYTVYKGSTPYSNKLICTEEQLKYIMDNYNIDEVKSLWRILKNTDEETMKRWFNY